MDQTESFSELQVLSTPDLIQQISTEVHLPLQGTPHAPRRSGFAAVASLH